MAEVAQQDHTIEAVAQIGALEDVSLEVRARVAAQMLEGRGSVEELVTQLAAALGKNVTFKLAEEASSGEGTESVVVVVADSEAQDEDPRLAALKTQYEGLSQADRTCSKGVMAWKQVVAAIPDMNEFLAGVESLSEPEVYWLDKDGQLVIGDGCAEPAEETLGLDYNQSRTAATKVKNRGLITLDEYKRKNKGQFEAKKWIWVESGENPSVARLAYWAVGYVYSYGNNANFLFDVLGSRRVLRVKLNLES